MGKKDKKQEEEVVEEVQNETTEEQVEQKEETKEEKLEAELAEQKEKFLRLYSEFENFKRRTAKEKLEMISTANEGLMVSLLSVLDDFERAQKSIEESEDINALKEGITLVYDKFYKALEQKGLKPINALGEVFDSELHEGITQIPAPSEDMKGKVVDEVEKGYYLGEKVVRFSKVVIGA